MPPITNSRPSAERTVPTVLRVPHWLHPMRNAVSAGLHHLPTAPLDLYARLQKTPLAKRPSLKLLLTIEQRRVFDEVAAGAQPAPNGPRRWPLWVVVSVALSLVDGAPSGRRSEAIAARRPAQGTPS